MIILALDTSGRHVSLALYTEDGLVLEHSEWGDNSISERLPGLLNSHVLPCINDFSRIDAIGACIGPGPFTGIRIGLTVCKALIVRHGLAFRPVVSLKALAYPYLGPLRQVAVVMDARRGQYYAAIYEHRSEGIFEIMPPSVFSETELPDRISPWGIQLPVVGLMSDAVADKLTFAGLVPVRRQPFLAREIASLTRDEVSLWLKDPQELQPLYLRDPDAVIGRT